MGGKRQCRVNLASICTTRRRTLGEARKGNRMQGLIGAIVAAFAGIAVGFWLRSASVKAEKAQLAQRALELSAELAAERERLRVETQARAEADRVQAGTIARLEAELKAERQSLAEKLAMLDSAKQTLANQFEALARKTWERFSIHLRRKSRSFATRSSRRRATPRPASQNWKASSAISAASTSSWPTKPAT
jgi:DNA anti-recombination protein RmuC